MIRSLFPFPSTLIVNRAISTSLFFIPIIPLNKISEHVQCAICGTRYRMDVLAVPTAAQMQEALPAGMRAAATGILRAGGGSSGSARRRAIDAIKGAGLEPRGAAK